MAELRFVDWDGLVYYDDKVKEYIREKLETCIKFAGEVASREDLVDPSYDTVNYMFKVLNEFTVDINDDDFREDLQGRTYAPGTIVQVIDYDNIYKYSILFEPGGDAADIIALATRLSELEHSLDEVNRTIDTHSTELEEIKKTYASKELVQELIDQ